MKQYTAMLRAVFMAETDVDAILIADTICENGMRDLEEDEGDSLDVVGVNLSRYGSRTTLVWYLQQTRDLLIRTKIRQCFDQARELDRMAWIIEHKAEEHFDACDYNYGEFMEHAKKLLGDGYAEYD